MARTARPGVPRWRRGAAATGGAAGASRAPRALRRPARPGARRGAAAGPATRVRRAVPRPAFRAGPGRACDGPVSARGPGGGRPDGPRRRSRPASHAAAERRPGPAAGATAVPAGVRGSADRCLLRPVDHPRRPRHGVGGSVTERFTHDPRFAVTARAGLSAAAALTFAPGTDTGPRLLVPVDV